MDSAAPSSPATPGSNPNHIIVNVYEIVNNIFLQNSEN